MKRLALTLAALTTSSLLAGCGFTPLYAVPGVNSGLANVEVITPEGRTGHLLAEDLHAELGSDRSQPAYRLNLALDERRYARGLQVEDVASWYELTVLVDYSLVDVQTGKTMTAGRVPVSVSYNAVRDPYAGVVAQQDGQRRAASQAAMKLRLELSRFFAARGASPQS